MTDLIQTVLERLHQPLGIALMGFSLVLFALCLRPWRPVMRAASPGGPRPAPQRRPARTPGGGARRPQPMRPPQTEPPRPAARRLPEVQGRTNLAATKDGLELTLELPGLDEKDLKVEVVRGVLTISGEVRAAGERPHRMGDPGRGVFSRSIQLPAGVRSDRIEASLHQGLLTVSIPKPSPPEPGRIFVHGGPMRLNRTADAMEVTLDLPGVQEKDIEVVVSHDLLTVRGGVASGGAAPFSRSFKLPWGANADQIKAAVRMGVLKVTVPAPVKYEFKRIEVRPPAP